MENENLNERLAKVETTVDEHTRLLNIQADKNETLTRLTTLIERQMEESKEKDRQQEIYKKEQAKQMENFSNTLQTINENLTNLNNQQAQLSNRVTDIEGTLSENKNNKKDTWKFILTNIATFIMSVLLAYLLFKLGLNNGNLM